METMDVFRPGQNVLLKCGGPKMTILRCYTDATAVCAWFDGNAKQEARFPLVALSDPLPRAFRASEVRIGEFGGPADFDITVPEATIAD